MSTDAAPEITAQVKERLPMAHLTHGAGKGHATNTVRILSGSEEDGTAVFVCNKTPECQYTQDSFQGVFAHSASHTAALKKAQREADKAAAKAAKPNGQPVDAADVVSSMKASHKPSKLSTNLLNLAAVAETLEHQAKEGGGAWKDRALKAERENKTIRKALDTLGISIKV